MSGVITPEADDFVSFFLSLFLFLNVFNLILFIYLFLRTFKPFLNKMLIMFEYFAGKITNFDANGGRIFLDLGHILRGCSESGLCLYSGECISSIFFLEARIGSILYRYYNWFETFPETCFEMLMKNYPSKFTSEILEKFSNTFRLFFLLDFRFSWWVHWQWLCHFTSFTPNILQFGRMYEFSSPHAKVPYWYSTKWL